MSTLVEIEAADRGVFLRARQKVVSQMSFAGGVILAALASDDSLVGLTVTRLGSIELQLLSDIARSDDLDFGALLIAPEPEHAPRTKHRIKPIRGQKFFDARMLAAKDL